MELGEKIKQARLEAGFSQRQLCGEEITRNMLSLIEHGSARPSMDTLRYLAGRLGKPVSFFLEEEAVISPNQDSMLQARAAYEAGNWEEAKLLLENFQGPDPIFQWEYQFLKAAATLCAAESALAKGKDLYARELLAEAEPFCKTFAGMERQRLLLLSQVRGANLTEICRCLPSLEEELLLRARGAMKQDPVRAGQLLDAMEEKETARWQYFRGLAYLGRGEFQLAADHLTRAEKAYSKETLPLVERCYRELGDYKRAYEYALKQR